MSADWFIRWLVIAVVLMVDAIWMRAKGIGIEAKSFAGPLGMAGVFVAWCFVSSVLGRKKTSLSTMLLSTSDYFYSMIQLMLMLLPLVTLTYLAATVNLPLADHALSRIDAFFGFDWPSVSAWALSYPAVAEGLRLSYISAMWQLFIVLFLSSVDQPGLANSEFIWNFLVSVLIVTAISAIVPALGYEGVIGSGHIDALRELRAGAWTTLDFSKIDGIITFPSFHAALGLACSSLIACDAPDGRSGSWLR